MRFVIHRVSCMLSIVWGPQELERVVRVLDTRRRERSNTALCKYGFMQIHYDTCVAARGSRLSNSSPNVTVSFSQIHGTDEARREISETVVADYNAETFARAARRRKLAGLVRWLRAETRGTPVSHPSSKPFRSIPLIR